MSQFPKSAGAGAFPATRYSLLEAVASSEEAARSRAFGLLVETYWKPVYKVLRVKWRASPEEAEDLTQEFFTRALERAFFDRFDPAVGRFRTYLRTCLDRFAANQHRNAHREKRGGGQAALSLDFGLAEGELVEGGLATEASAEDYFQREWLRSFFELAVVALEARCRRAGKDLHFALFERYDLARDEASRPTYADLAKEHSLPLTQVTNFLAWVRRELRKIVLERLRALTASEAEFRAEARSLFGIEVE